MRSLCSLQQNSPHKEQKKSCFLNTRSSSSCWQQLQCKELFEPSTAPRGAPDLVTESLEVSSPSRTSALSLEKMDVTPEKDNTPHIKCVSAEFRLHLKRGWWAQRRRRQLAGPAAPRWTIRSFATFFNTSKIIKKSQSNFKPSEDKCDNILSVLLLMKMTSESRLTSQSAVKWSFTLGHVGMQKCTHLPG